MSRPERVGRLLRQIEHETQVAFDEHTELFNLNNQLKAENAKLVDVLHEVETEAVYAYHCLQQDCMTTADSSEHFFKKWWHAECELDRLNAENAKLTKLARWMYQVMDESCAVHYPYKPAPVSMQALMRAEKELQALGIEVGK